jgi:uncharacterized membrane protein YfcA
MGLPVLSWLWLALSIAFASYVQNLTGFAFSLLFLGAVGSFDLLPIAEAANAVSVITLFQAVVYFRAFPLRSDWLVIRPAIVPSLFGVIAGAWLLAWLSGHALYLLKIALGGVIIATALTMVMRSRPREHVSSRWAFQGAGLVSGLMGGLFSTAGPPLVYLLYRQPLPQTLVHQCLLLMFGVGQSLRLAYLLVTGSFTWNSLLYVLISAPIVVGVTHLNRRWPLRLPLQVITRMAAVLLFWSGLGLIWAALA